jgi:hypothetical protein
MTRDAAMITGGAVFLSKEMLDASPGSRWSATCAAYGHIQQDGTFVLQNVQPGRYALSLCVGIDDHESICHWIPSILVEAHQTTQLGDVTIAGAGACVTLKVRDASGGPVRDPEVLVSTSTGHWLPFFFYHDNQDYDEAGIIRLDPFPQGTYNVAVFSRHHAATLFQIRVESGQFVEQVVILRGGGALEITVYDAADRPLPNASIELLDNEGQPLHLASILLNAEWKLPRTTDAQGLLVFNRLAAGRYQVVVRGFAETEPTFQEVTVVEGNKTVLEIRGQR